MVDSFIRSGSLLKLLARVWRQYCVGSLSTKALLLGGLLLALAVSPLAPSPASADPVSVTTLVRVLGPADEDTFATTGEYETIWAGDVSVPSEATVTARNGDQYRLYVEDGRYLADSPVGEDELITEDLGPGDDDLGATSVLAALHEASVRGGFEYEISDEYFPTQFYLTGVSGFRAHGAVGWNYRINNGERAPSPRASIGMFMLGYDSSAPPPPHNEVIIYWGYGTGCRPLRIEAPSGPVQCGEPVEFTVERFVDDGYDGNGAWEPLGGAELCSEGVCVETGPDGTAGLTFNETGTYSLSATAPYDGEYYYVPSEGVTTIDVEGPCEIVSFTVEDHGEPGLNFGLVARGTDANPEQDQTSDHGAVTLHVGDETTVDCDLQLSGGADLEGDTGSDSLTLSGLAWATTHDEQDGVPVTTEYATVGSSTAGVERSIDLWHWLSVPADQSPDAYVGEFRYRIVSSSS